MPAPGDRQRPRRAPGRLVRRRAVAGECAPGRARGTASSSPTSAVRGVRAAWIQPQLGDWGGVDAADLLAAVDHVVDRGLADPARLGILGLSYGGFMVNWLVGAAPGRFRAAVSENGVTNQLSGWANSDSGPSTTGWRCSATR